MSAKILRFPAKAAPLLGLPHADATASSAAFGPPPKLGGETAPVPVLGRPDDPSRPLVARRLARLPRILTPSERVLQERMLEAFYEGERLARNYDPTTIRRDRRHVLAFLEFVGQPPWQCTPSDFEAWAARLSLERHLAAGSQRVMQGAIATFFDYLVGHTEWQNEVHRQCDTRLVQVATSENRVVHTTDKARVLQRTYLTGDELTQLFAVLASVVEIASIETPRLLKTFQRDRAMFYVYYAYGLRLAEGHGLNINSFFKNAQAPEMGRCGFVGVYGKGSRGSGKRYRTVPGVHADLPAVMTWYLKEVRPKFLCKDEQALWLSERGRRLCRSAIATRFKRVLTACGFDARLFSTHGLRHMSVSHQAEAGVPMAFTSQIHGHTHMATTTTYTHLSDSFSENIAKNIIAATLSARDDA